MDNEINLNGLNTNLLDTITKEEAVFKPLIQSLEDSGIEEKIEIKEVLSIKLLKLMADLEDKITNGRIKDKDTEKIRIDYYKTYITTINTYLKLSKDTRTKYNKEEVITLLNNL